MQQLSINRKPKLAQAEYGDSSKIKSNFLRAMIMLPKPSLSYGNSTCPKTPQRRTFLEEAEAGPVESGVFCRSVVVPLYPITNSVAIKLVATQFLSIILETIIPFYILA